jgi:rhodanese-related sulfurtransferase
MQCEVVELKNCLSQKDAILVDVREYPEFASERVKGSILIPLGDIEKRYTELPREKTIYLMCRTGRRAAEAQKKLLALGFSDVRVVKGGFEAWKAAGFECEKDDNAVWSIERQVRFVAGFLVLSGVVLSWLIHPYFILLSGFVGAGLMFAAITDTCAMGMLLAKMPWNNIKTCQKEAKI